MKTHHKHILKLLFQLLLLELTVTDLQSVTGSDFINNTTSATPTWVGSKYNIDCTMCSACDNPCNTPPSPPQTTTPIYPPPPAPPSSGGGGGYYYYPPPKPSTPYVYYPPPAPGGGYYKPPQTYPTGPTPPPPNPIVSYFPFYYHSPPDAVTASAFREMISLPLMAVVVIVAWPLITGRFLV